MLSPDVPEFVPREFQNPEALARIESGLRHDPNNTSYSHSVSPHCSLDQVQSDGRDNGRSATVCSPKYEEETSGLNNFSGSHHNAYKPKYTSHTDGNWRNARTDNWTSNRNSTAESNNVGKKKKFPDRSSSYETYSEGKQNWREKNCQSPSTDNSQGLRQRNAKVPFVKQNVSFSGDHLTQSAHGLEAMSAINKWESKSGPQILPFSEKQSKTQSGASKKEGHINYDVASGGVQVEGKQRKTELKVKTSAITPDSTVYQGAKAEKTEFSIPVKPDRGNVSYKKILSRKSDSEIVTVKTERNVNLIPSHSEDQWPSLFGPRSQNPAGKSDDNAWRIKNNDPESLSWPRASPKEASPILNSHGNKVPYKTRSTAEENFKPKRNGNKQWNKDYAKEKSGVGVESVELYDNWDKKGRGSQVRYQKPMKSRSVDKDEKEVGNRNMPINKLDTLEKRDEFRESTLDCHVVKAKDKDNSKKIQRNYGNFDELDVSHKGQPEPSSINGIMTSRNTKSETEEDETSQWQIKKKKKPKIREQQEGGDSMKFVEGNSRPKNRERGSEKNERLQNKFSKTPKFSDRAKGDAKIGKSNKPPDSKYPETEEEWNKSKRSSVNYKRDKTQQSKFTKEDNHTDCRESRTESIHERQVKGRDKSLHTEEKMGNTIRNGRTRMKRDDAEKPLPCELVSDTASKDALGSNRGPSFQKPGISGVKEKPGVENNANQKANAERKAKKKEDKMRKRELKLKEAQALMTTDSKVTMVSKEVLEMVYHSNNQQHKKSSFRPLSRGRGGHQRDPPRSHESFQFACEEYPSLMKEESKVPIVTEQFLDINDQDYYNSYSSDEDNSEMRGKEFTEIPSSQGEIMKKREMDKTSLKSHIVRNNSSKYDQEDISQSNGIFIQDKDGDTPENPASSVPSYSRALLANKSRKKVLQQDPAKGVTTSKVAAAPKKKVRTRDEVTFDLLDAVAKQKIKRKDKSAVDIAGAMKKPTMKGDRGDGDLMAAARKKKMQSKSKALLAALDPDFLKSRSTGTLSIGEGEGDLSPIKVVKRKKTTKQRAEVVVRRGKQREVKKKKKLSPLKKAMKRAKQLEMENLHSVLQDANKFHENSVPARMPINEDTCTVIGVDASIVSVDSSITNTSEPTEGKQMDDLQKGSVNSDILEIRAYEDKVKETRNVDNASLDHEILENPEINRELSNLDSDANGEVMKVTDDKELKDSNERAEEVIPLETIEKENQKSQNSVNQVNGINNSVNPEFSKNCLNLVEELGIIRNSVHKTSFREYCNHVITPEVAQAAKELISSLVRFQERQYQNDPVKARIRRRYVCGLKSTTKKMAKMSCIIVAPNIKRCKGPGALDEVVEKMLNEAEKLGVPVIFALSAKRIGILCLKRICVSCVGIINYHGAQDIFHRLMELLPVAQKQYQDLIANGSRTIPVGDEPSDAESEPDPEKIKDVTLINATLSSATPEEGSGKGDLLPASLNTREEVIASVVAILNEKTGKECQPIKTEE